MKAAEARRLTNQYAAPDWSGSILEDVRAAAAHGRHSVEVADEDMNSTTRDVLEELGYTVTRFEKYLPARGGWGHARDERFEFVWRVSW